MQFTQLAAVAALAGCLLLTGCGGRQDSLAVACEKLEIKHCKKASTSVDYDVNQKITQLLEQQSGELESKLVEINRKLDPLISKSFLVDINQYQDVRGLTSILRSQKGKKLDRVKVFAADAPLPHAPSSGKPRSVFDGFSSLELTIRENSPKIKKYTQIKELCDQILFAACKVNYIGILDGVWTQNEGVPSTISGWIEYEEITLVPFTLETLRHSAHEIARKAVFKIIHDKNGEISWLQIEEEANRAIAQIK